MKFQFFLFSIVVTVEFPIQYLISDYQTNCYIIFLQNFMRMNYKVKELRKSCFSDFQLSQKVIFYLLSRKKSYQKMDFYSWNFLWIVSCERSCFLNIRSFRNTKICPRIPNLCIAKHPIDKYYTKWITIHPIKFYKKCSFLLFNFVISDFAFN